MTQLLHGVVEVLNCTVLACTHELLHAVVIKNQYWNLEDCGHILIWK